MTALDTPQLVAIAAALGWASGLRLYAVLFLVGLAGTLGWVDLPAGRATAAASADAHRQRADARRRVLRRQDPRRRHAVGRDAHAAAHPRRRGARGGRFRRRLGHRHRRRRAARRHAGGDQPLRQGDDARRGQHLARAVLQHRPLARRRCCRARRAVAGLGASVGVLRRARAGAGADGGAAVEARGLPGPVAAEARRRPGRRQCPRPDCNDDDRPSKPASFVPAAGGPAPAAVQRIRARTDASEGERVAHWLSRRPARIGPP